MRIAILIDGGHLRVLVRHAGSTYDPDYIEKVARACVKPDETVLRILYYDCAPFAGAKLPVSGLTHGSRAQTLGSNNWRPRISLLFGEAS
jgi:hypothetical protein